MGSMSVVKALLPHQLEDESTGDAPSAKGALRSFAATELAANGRASTWYELTLLSWLIVLLRTRDASQVRFEWTLVGPDDGPEHELSIRSLSVDDIVPGMHVTVAEARTTMSRHIATSTQDKDEGDVKSDVLLLSTSSLSRLPGQPGDEETLHFKIRMCNGQLEVVPAWHTENTLPQTVTRHIETLIDTIRLCISGPDASVQDLMRPTAYDLDEIWRWNHELPPVYDYCMHEMISERAIECPDTTAILSWDGSLTYSQVETYSTQLACSLKDMGIQLHDVLPVCFEKSRWTIVAVLAVMKVGATLVLMDPTLPLARLREMARQTGARNILTSTDHCDLSGTIVPYGECIVVNEAFLADMPDPRSAPALPSVPASALMYIIFTSGSTGSPKGVKISHGTYTSSAIPRAKAVGYTKSSRVLDFASYAFDVSIDSMLLTLGNGGCLCIPSDEDRLNDINGVMRRMEVNYAGLTPSVGRILDADVISSLEGLGLGGEAVSARDVGLWGRDTRIIIGYGPCECTIGCTVNASAATGRDYISIGPGNGAAIWITHPEDHEKLMPVGAVGELLVEGPIVGQGYLNDPEKTAAAFIEDPAWLVAGHKHYTGRQSRLYKTGDLGKYDPDGSGGIVFVGRKDTQVKLRGQRVELGEIESQLQDRLPPNITVIAEVLKHPGPATQPMLVAFIASRAVKGQTHSELERISLPDELREALSKASADLAEVLPRYMMPTVYIPVNFIPVLISGKTDRKKLREFGITVDLQQLNRDEIEGDTATRPLNDLEKRLRQAWSQTLSREPEGIRLDDNFFALGGDSLAAMRLVSVCRQHGLDLTVVNTFNHPILEAMASVVQLSNAQAKVEIPAFSMISQATEVACIDAAHAIGIDATAIEDMYPCTPTQESLFTFSLKADEPYVAQRVAQIPPHISTDSWKNAWGIVATALPILRTRVAQLSEPGLQQVVVNESIQWKYSNNLKQYLENDLSQRMDLGQNLARYAIVENGKDSKRFMVWTVHHVLYDGWSEQLILRYVSQALESQSFDCLPHIKDFVRYVRDTDVTVMRNFWRQELEGAVGPQFPGLPSRDYLPTPDGLVERHIPFNAGVGSPFTMATYIRGAWALVASQYTGNDDVVFGETLTGRDISLPDVDRIIGPLITTLPVRVRINRKGPVTSYLQGIQQSMSARTPYQHMGMQNIRKVSQDAQHACEAPTGLVVQLEPDYVGAELGLERGDVVREALHFNPYPLMLACVIQQDGFRVCASFDTGLVGIDQMERVLAQLEMACTQLIDLNKTVDEVSCLSPVELDQIWDWNRIAPMVIGESPQRLRAEDSIQQGSAYPPAVVTWVCDPRNPALLSPIGCIGELWLEGDVLSGETVMSPAWLKAGSSAVSGRKGKVQSTGDLVKLQHDGRLTFVRRKDESLLVRGHAVDVAQLEEHVRAHLPPNTRAAVAVSRPVSHDEDDQSSKRQVIVFAEQQGRSESAVSLMSADYTVTNAEVVVVANVSMSLVGGLKKLDKFVRDSLPSSMAPSAYVVIDRLPIDKGQIDRKALSLLASELPAVVLERLRQGLEAATTHTLAESNRTAEESVLQASWAQILGISPQKIDIDDNFFRLGGDSVLAMRLASNVRKQGHELTVADIFKHMRLSDAAKVLKLNQAAEVAKRPAYRPYSMVRHMGDQEAVVSKIVRPQLVDPHLHVQDMYPVTDTQAIDIEATIRAPRTGVQYTMLYFSPKTDQERLLRACSDLVKTHEILRTVFIEHESKFYQVIVSDPDTVIEVHRTDGNVEECARDRCTVDIEECDLRLGAPFLKMSLVRDEQEGLCLTIRLSHAQYDGISLPRMLQDLSSLYTGLPLDKYAPFTSYISHVGDESTHTKALKYWRDLLEGSSISSLDITPAQPTQRSTFGAKEVDISALPRDVTTANLLTAAWALLLIRHLKRRDVTFGNITSGRNIPALPDVDKVIGPCYQFSPVRVVLESLWTAIDLLHYVQEQVAESAAHDFVGIKRIAKDCTQWPAVASFFDSVIHHQDVSEESEIIPFADGSYTAEVVKPHGDAAYNFAVYLAVRGGRTNVGIMGGDAAVVETVLEELASTIEELAACRSELIVLETQGSS